MPANPTSRFLVAAAAALVAFVLATLLALGSPTTAGAQDPLFGEASTDGRTVFFTTRSSLVGADDDGLRPDVYRWRNGTVSLVSVDQAGSNFPRRARFLDAASDGSAALFDTYFPLVAPDEPSDNDIYRNSGGTTARVSTGPSARTCGTCFQLDTAFVGASPDLSRVVFSTGDRLTAGDSDDQPDVYARRGGNTTLLSTGPAGGNGDFRADGEGTASGTVFFSTQESLVLADTTPGSYDLYRRSPSGLDLVGPEHFFHRSSASGDRAIFSHPGRLVPADTDSESDIYEWTQAGGIRLLSKGAGARGNGPFRARWKGQSDDARRVAFYTDERMVPEDKDSLRDLYVAFNGNIKLISTGPRGNNGSLTPRFGGMSADGRFTYFMTQERLVRADRDRASDLYMRGSGKTIRISSRGGRFAASNNGLRVIFISAKPQVSADRDTNADLYSYSNGRVRLLSKGPRGGNSSGSSAYITFGGATPDARHAYFLTREKLVAADRDNDDDLYANSRGRVILISRPSD
jgi:hypothetical protein